MKFSKCSFLVLACLCLSFVGGCKKSLEAQVVGQWNGKVVMPNGQAANANLPDQTLDVKADKTFTLSGGMEGTWDAAGEKLNLHWTKMMGMEKAKLKEMQEKLGESNPALKATPEQVANLDKPIVFDLSGDGKTLTSEPTAVGGKAGEMPVLSLTKSETPAK